MRAAVYRLSPREGGYRESADAIDPNHPDGDAILKLSGILTALRDDYKAGYLRTVEELVHADVFADFLEMADELVSKAYKDPAAVIAGSVLEEHLRKLALPVGVALAAPNGQPKKADVINADLVKAGVYNKLEQKDVTAWLGVRKLIASSRIGARRRSSKPNAS